MANAYSIVHQYGEPKSNFDVDLASAVLTNKQQRFDSNLMKIEQTLMSMGIQAETIKNQAGKEKLYNNITNMVNSIQGLNAQDLSKRGITSEIIGTIQGALDEDSIYHISAGQRIDRFNSSVQESIDANDGTYSDKNYQDAIIRSGLQGYLQGDAKARMSGDLTYHKYVDYTKILMEEAERSKKLHGKQIIEQVQPDGSIKKVTVDNMTAAEWVNYLPTLITPQMQKQMEIDGAAMFGWDTENLGQYKERYRQQAHKEADNKIESLENELKQDLPDKVRKEIEVELKTARDYKESVDNIVESGINDIYKVGGQLVMEDSILKLAGLMGNGESIEWRNIRTDSEKSSTSKGNKSDKIDISLADFVTSIPIATEQRSIKAKTILEDNLNANRTYRQSVNSLYNSLPSELKSTVDGLADERLKKVPDMKREDALYYALDNIDYAKLNTRDFKNTQQQLDEVRKNKEEVEMRNSKMVAVYDQANEDLWTDNYVRDYNTLKRAKGPVKEILRQNGVENAEQYLDFISSKEGKELKQIVNGVSFFKRLAARSEGDMFGSQIGRTGEGVTFRNVNVNRDLIEVFEIAKTTLGEDNLLFSDVFKVTDNSGREIPSEKVEETIFNNGYLPNVTLRNNTDSRLRDIFTSAVDVDPSRMGETESWLYTTAGMIGDLHSKSDRQRKIVDYYLSSDIKLTGDNIIVVPTFSGAAGQKERLYREAQAVFTVGRRTGLLEPNGQDVKLQVEGDIVRLSQAKYSTAKGDYEVYAEVPMTQFMAAAPTMYNMMEEHEAPNQMVYSNPEGRQVTNYINTNNRKVLTHIADFAGEEILPYIVKSSAKESVLGKYDPNSPTYKLFEKAFDDPSKFVIDYEQGLGEDYIVVSTTRRENNATVKDEVYRLDVSKLSKTEVGKIRRNYPQYFVTLALNDMILGLQNNPNEQDNIEFKNFIRAYGN